MNPLDDIRRLYFQTSKATIEQDIARAIDLLKSMHDEHEREKAAVFMQGLAELRREFGAATRKRSR